MNQTVKNIFALSFVLVSSQALATSAAFVRSLSRSTQTDGADRALYNPASSAHLEGCQLYVSSLSVYRDWDIRAVGASYDTSVAAPVVPELHAACGHDKLGFYGAVYPSGGAAAFGKGLPSYIKEMNTTLKTGIQNQSLNPRLAQPATLVADPVVKIDAQKLNANLQLGAAYAWNDQFAVSLGVGPVLAQNQIVAKLRYKTVSQPSPERDYSHFDIRYQQKAFGLAPVLGLNWQAEGWETTLRYQGRVPLRLKTKIQKDETADIAQAAGMEPVVQEGEILAEDVPAVAQIGLAKAFGVHQLRTELTYNFSRAARAEAWQSALDHKAIVYNNPELGKVSERKDAWTAAAAYEQKLSADWLVSGGLRYAYAGSKPSLNLDEQHLLNSYSYAAGAQYRWSDVTHLDFAYLLVDSIDSYNQDATEVYRMREHILGFGLNRNL